MRRKGTSKHTSEEQPDREPPPSNPMADIAPVPVFPNLAGIVVFGGTFDPPHTAHVTLPMQACEALFGIGQGMVLFVPAAVSPFKVGKTKQVPAHHRARMLELAIEETLEDSARARIWDDEICRAHASQTSSAMSKPSYMIDTLRRLGMQVGESTPLRLLIGADQAVAFHRWRSFSEILRIAPPAVMLRQPWTTVDTFVHELTKTGAWAPSEIDDWRRCVVDVPVEPARSTDVRDDITRLWQSDDQFSSHADIDIAPSVAQYIREHGLYKSASCRDIT